MRADRPRNHGKRQGIDEARKRIGIEIRHPRRCRARHGVGKRAAREGTGGRQSRALNESTASCHTVNLPWCGSMKQQGHGISPVPSSTVDILRLPQRWRLPAEGDYQP
jgi:hypothetical protein